MTCSRLQLGVRCAEKIWILWRSNSFLLHFLLQKSPCYFFLFSSRTLQYYQPHICFASKRRRAQSRTQMFRVSFLTVPETKHLKVSELITFLVLRKILQITKNKIEIFIQTLLWTSRLCQDFWFVCIQKFIDAFGIFLFLNFA